MPADKPAKRSPRKKSIATPTPIDAVAQAEQQRADATPTLSSAPGAADAPRANPTPARLAFLRGWEERQQGDITAGGLLVVEYEPARLVADDDAAAAEAGSEIVGYARFSPSGEIRRATLLGEPAPRRAIADLSPVTVEVPVPVEAERVELWFERAEPSGESRWDSRFGANYEFSVVRPSPLA